VPGNHHRHDDGLARAGGHLATLPCEGAAIAGNFNPHPLGAGASVSQISVSTASNWQKKKRRNSSASGSCQ
jgi:hypothetical protein